jgi:hypothetical protein
MWMVTLRIAEISSIKAYAALADHSLGAGAPTLDLINVGARLFIVPPVYSTVPSAIKPNIIS